VYIAGNARALLIRRRRYACQVKVLRISLIYVAGIGLGIAVGLWTLSMTDACPAFCLVGVPRFSAAECVVMGVLTSIAVLTVALAVDQDFPSETAHVYLTVTRCSRTVARFLFEDLSRQREP
jgi:hypothetical protein